MNDGTYLADALTEIGKRLVNAEQYKSTSEYFSKELDEAKAELRKCKADLQTSQQNHLALSHKFHDQEKLIDSDLKKRINELSISLTRALEDKNKYKHDYEKVLEQRDAANKNFLESINKCHNQALKIGQLTEQLKRCKKKKRTTS